MRHTSKRSKTGATILAALLASAGGPVFAQNAGGGASGGNAGAAGGGGAGGNAGAAAGVGGTTGVSGNNGATAGGNSNNGTAGAGANGATNGGNTGVGGNNGNNTGGGTGGNGTTGGGQGTVSGTMGTNGALSNGASPGGSVPVTGNPAPQRYDLARTIADALQASADVETATRNVQIDQKQADVEAAQGRPNINAQGTATRYDAATKVAIGGGMPGTPPSPPLTVLPNATQVLSLNLSEQFDIDGQIRAGIEEYRLQSQADQYVLQQVSNARILRAKSVYFNFLQTYHQVQVAQANLDDANENLTDARNQNAAGTGLKLDLLRAQTQVAQDQQQLEQAQDNFSVAESTFNDLVGRPLNTPITLDDVPGVTVGTSPDNAGAVGAPTDQALFPPPDLSGVNLDRSLQTAYTHRPEILGDRVNVQVAGINVTLARAGLEPTLAGSINGFYFPTTDFQNPRKRTAQASITLTIPLYDGDRAHDLIQEAHLRQANAQTTLDSQVSDVTLDVREAYLNLVTAATQIDSANSALQSAVAARQNAEIRYRGGVGLFLEVTDAQAALVQAQNSQINAVYNYLIAQAQFQNAVGTPQTQ